MKATLYVDNYYYAMGYDFDSLRITDGQRATQVRISMILQCFEKLDRSPLIVLTDQFLIDTWQDVPEGISLRSYPQVAFSIFGGGLNMWNQLKSEIAVLLIPNQPTFCYVSNSPLQGAFGTLIPMEAHPEAA